MKRIKQMKKMTKGLLLLCIVATMVSSTTAAIAADKSGSTTSNLMLDVLTSIEQKILGSFNYWQHSFSAPDGYFPTAINNIKGWMRAENDNADFNKDIQNYNENITQQQIRANSLNVNTDPLTGIQGTPTATPSPANSIKTYMPDSDKNTLGSDLLPSTLFNNISLNTNTSKKLSPLMCSNAYFGGRSQDVLGGYNPTLSDSSSQGAISCHYSPELSNAVSFINHVSYNTVPFVDGVSGNNSEVKTALQNSPNYNTIVKNAIASRNVGIHALYDILQSNLGGAAKLSQKNSEARAKSTKWHAQMQSATVSALLREQTFMMADIQKQLSTLIQLQRQQLAVQAANEIQNANLMAKQSLEEIKQKSQAEKTLSSMPSSNND